MLSAASPADCLSPDGEPLCLPPPPEELCEAARRRLPAVEADLRRRLSGPDRSIEAAQLERLVAGLRQPLELGPDRPARPDGPGPGPEDDAHNDPILDQGLLALCAAQLLGARPLLHLPEGLALRGQRVRRGTLGRGGPPRALEVVDQIHRGERVPRPADRAALLDVCRGGRDLPAARALVALSEAALAPPLVLIDSAEAAGGRPFLHAGLPPALLPLLSRAAAPHALGDAAAPLSPLREAVEGRNPWHLYQIALAPWRDAWAGTQVLREPQLTAAGLALAQEVLGRQPSSDEAFALACCALGAAERLATLVAPGAGSSAEPAPIVDESAAGEREALLLGALRRLSRRPLCPGRGGEAALLLRQAAQSGLLVLLSHHDEELGRALLPLPPGAAPGANDLRAAQLRLLSFPREPPRALVASERIEEGGRRSVWLDGGDLRAQLLF